MQDQRIPQPLTCPACGGTLRLVVPTQTFECVLEHVCSIPELDDALRQVQQQNLQALKRQLQERELLLLKMGERGLLPTEQVDTLLPLSQKLGAALSTLAAHLNQAAT